MTSRTEVLNTLDQHRDTIRGYGVTSLRLFGSLARGEATLESDVDLLVDFESTPSFSRFMKLRIYLEDLLGRKVDLVTENGLKERARPWVEQDAIRVA